MNTPSNEGKWRQVGWIDSSSHELPYARQAHTILHQELRVNQCARPAGPQERSEHACKPRKPTTYIVAIMASGVIHLDPSASLKRTVLSPKHSIFSAMTVENCGVSLSKAAWPDGPKQIKTHAQEKQ